MLAGPSTKLLHSFHEDRNGSITVSEKAEQHAHSTSRKSWLHGTHMQFYVIKTNFFFSSFVLFWLWLWWSSSGSCTNKDISISQSKGSTSGIPQYIVQIVNTCVSGCAPHDIHLHCGWFASARIINPRLFKRLSFDDCLVNGGKPLASSQIIRFTYSNSFMYPLEFKSAKFCWVQNIKFS